MPDAGKRCMSLQITNEDSYVSAMYYGAGSYTITEKSVGTRYMVLGVRTLIDPSDPKDIEQVQACKMRPMSARAIRVSLNSQTGTPEGRKKVHDALLVLGSTMPDFKNAFGTKEQIDPVRHLIGTAALGAGSREGHNLSQY